MKKSLDTVEELKNFVFEPKWSNADDVKIIKKEKKIHRKKEKKFKQNKQFEFKFFIDQETSETLKAILRKDGITRKISTIVEEIVAKKRYGISIRWKSEQKKFLKINKENTFFLNVSDVIKNEIKYKKNLKIISDQKIKIEGNFGHILKCNKTNQLFPPTSHDLFKNMIDSHILEKGIEISIKDYVDQLEKISDTNIIDSFKGTEIWRKTFTVNDVTVDGLKSIKSMFTKNEGDIFYKEVDRIKCSASNIYKKKSLSKISRELSEIKKDTIIKDLYSNFVLLSKKSNLYLSKKDKSLFVSAYLLKKIEIHKLNSKSGLIINLLNANKDFTIKDIINNKLFIHENKGVILKEIRWLIISGYIRQYETGYLETM